MADQAAGLTGTSTRMLCDTQLPRQITSKLGWPYALQNKGRGKRRPEPTWDRRARHNPAEREAAGCDEVVLQHGRQTRTSRGRPSQQRRQQGRAALRELGHDSGGPRFRGQPPGSVTQCRGASPKDPPGDPAESRPYDPHPRPAFTAMAQGKGGRRAQGSHPPMHTTSCHPYLGGLAGKSGNRTNSGSVGVPKAPKRAMV